MTDVVSRTLSVHKEHEVLLKLETAGLNDELAQRVIDSKGNDLAAKVVRLIENSGFEIQDKMLSSLNPQGLWAREIMGKNFFGIEEAIEHFEVNPSKQQIAALAEVPFSEEVLESCKDTHILVAVFPMSILDVRRAYSSLFDSSTDGWYELEKFARNKGVIGWQLACKTPVEDSTYKNWNEQQKLLGKDDETPSAQVMVYAIVGHYRNMGERLFENVDVRCSCLDLRSYRVCVGDFVSGKLRVGDDLDDYRFSRLGVSAARKPCILNS